MVLETIRRHPFATGAVVLGAAIAAGRRKEGRIDPVAWHPPDPPEKTGVLAENDKLANAERIVYCKGPEDVAFDDEGYLYTGDEDGIIHRTKTPVDNEPTDLPLEAYAQVDGRPLGMEFYDDDLIVASESAGLLSVSSNGAVSTLTDNAGGRHTAFADDLHITDDGVVYFSDATVHDLYQDEMFELRDTGRLISYDLNTGETTVELEGLGFANGVAPGPDSQSVLVNETSRYRITQYWIEGDRAGESEVFVENLIGFPDNIDIHDDGSYWVAIPSLRDESLEKLQGRPQIKRMLGKLPESVLGQLSGDPYGLVLHLDENGEVIESLHDPEGDVFGVTSATPHQGALYLGTLFGNSVWRYPLN